MARVLTSVSPSENAPAQKGVAGGDPVRRQDDRERRGGRELAAGDRDKDQPRDPEHGEAHGAPRHEDPEAKAPPEEPGLVMVRQLAGDDRSDEALGRLLEDLDGLNEPVAEPEEPRKGARPVPPFATSKSIDSPFSRAASAYEWGHQTLNRVDPIRPGSVYSERF